MDETARDRAWDKEGQALDAPPCALFVLWVSARSSFCRNHIVCDPNAPCNLGGSVLSDAVGPLRCSNRRLKNPVPPGPAMVNRKGRWRRRHCRRCGPLISRAGIARLLTRSVQVKWHTEAVMPYGLHLRGGPEPTLQRCTNPRRPSRFQLECSRDT
jgi:hypothetical protein